MRKPLLKDIVMSLQNRIESLKVKHASIKYKLDAQSKTPHRNGIEL